MYWPIMYKAIVVYSIFVVF